MTRLTLATLLGLALATGLAWRLSGSTGTGVLVGFVFGAGMTGFGLAWQAHVARTRPEAVLRAFGESFLLKLAVLVGGALALRFVEPAGARVDLQAFCVSFAATAALLLVVGAPEAARGLRAAGRGAAALDGDSPA